MKKAYWVIGGVIAVSAAFFIPDPAGNLWNAVWASTAAGMLYLLIFAAVWLKKLEPGGKKLGAGIVLGLLVLSTGASAVINYKSSERQSKLLPEIHLIIQQGIAANYMMTPLLETMRAYYGEENEARRGLGDIFMNANDSLVTEDNRYRYGSYDEESPLTIYVTTARPDSVVLTAVSDRQDGMEPGFQNYDGTAGSFQAKGILTPNGVRYEREN